MQFFSQFPGTRFTMPNGSVLTFHNGVYETNDKKEIEELMNAIKSSSEVIGLERRRTVANDAHILKEVGKTTGTVNSSRLAQIAALSDGTA